MGYITWVVIALVFGFLKWRKILLLAPIAAALLIAFIPAMQERISEGFTEESMTSSSRIEAYQYRSDDEADLYTITAGRTFAWGFVVEEILEAPMLGHGRQAMVTTGIAPFLYSEYGESFPHPHNAYLQWLLDNGLIGTIPVFFLFLFVVRRSLNLLRCEQSTICVATAGFALSLILALLVAAMGSQTFYPREGAVGMWCAMGLALRVYVQWQRWLDAGHAVESIDGNENFWRLRQDAIGTAR
jgi:O-antigen ligase